MQLTLDERRSQEFKTVGVLVDGLVDAARKDQKPGQVGHASAPNGLTVYVLKSGRIQFFVQHARMSKPDVLRLLVKNPHMYVAEAQAKGVA